MTNPTLEQDIERVAERTGLLPSVVRACLTNYTAEAKAAAWEEGCEEGLSWNPGYDDEALARNPYRAGLAEANREHLDQFRDWTPGDPIE